MTRARVSTRASLLVALGSLFLVAGCGDDEPQAAPTSPPESSSAVETSAETSPPAESSASASPTASPTPTIVKPTLPPEAEVQDHTGATAFVRYWWENFNYAYASGDATELKPISTDFCTFCQSVIDDVEARTQDDLRTEGGEVVVIDAAAPPDEVVTTVYRVTTVVRQEAGGVYESDGSDAGKITNDGHAASQALVVWEEDRWVMDVMTLAPASEG